MKSDNIYIRKFKTEDAEQVSKLIITVFDEQVSKKLPARAKKFFSDGNTHNKIISLNQSGEMFVADLFGKIIGVVAGRDNNLITRLFVYKKFQGKGIAKNLMGRIESLYKRRGADAIHVRSALNAVDFYISTGYKKVTRVIHKKDGLVYQPMIKRIR
ncbi:MAG: GNAT family N-acetyltransferase [Gammaproteobacteria bacterium]|nr:GNAT family N-acetyltransferase [Gammaproteobacteria bacterium]